MSEPLKDLLSPSEHLHVAERLAVQAEAEGNNSATAMNASIHATLSLAHAQIATAQLQMMRAML
jgi:hypothetical protein